MDLDIKDATALVTGSCGGIRLADPRVLCAEAARAIVDGRSEASRPRRRREDFAEALAVG